MFVIPAHGLLADTVYTVTSAACHHFVSHPLCTDNLRPRSAAYRTSHTFKRYTFGSIEERISCWIQSYRHASIACHCGSSTTTSRMDKWSGRHDRPAGQDSRDCSCSSRILATHATGEYFKQSYCRHCTCPCNNSYIPVLL